MAHAELSWAQKTLELNAAPNDTVLEARFHFSNDGATPVDIREVQSSCGCTTVTLAQRHFDPGKGGEIVAHFTVGERVGLQRKTILVSTTDRPMATALSLVVHIPELLHLEPAALTWQQGEPPTAKMISIEALPDAAAPEEVTAQSSNPAMKVELQPAPDSRRYQLRVTPQTTDRTLLTTVTIHCRLGTDAKTFRAFAFVQAAAPTPRATAAPAPGG